MKINAEIYYIELNDFDPLIAKNGQNIQPGF